MLDESSRFLPFGVCLKIAFFDDDFTSPFAVNFALPFAFGLSLRICSSESISVRLAAISCIS